MCSRHLLPSHYFEKLGIHRWYQSHLQQVLNASLPQGDLVPDLNYEVPEAV